MYPEHDIAAFGGYLKDNDELLQCSSGGIATALSKKMIDNDGFVAGVCYSDDFHIAQYEIVNSINDLGKFKGTKYVETDRGSVFSDVKKLLDEDEAVLFIGLPCTIAGLRAFLSCDYEKLITVELICHGPTVSKVHTEYIDFLEKKYNSKIVEFSVKKKLQGWTPGYLFARFENGKTFSENFYYTEYGYAFSVLAKKHCYSCKFRGNNRTGDIMIGDFWGATADDCFWNKDGVSSILVHTDKGLEFLKSAENIELFDTTFDRVLSKNPNIIKPREKRPETEKFEKLLSQHDLFYSCEHSKKFLPRVKSIIKKLIK